MKYTEFGEKNETSLFIFVGGGVCWKPGALPFINEAKKKYHVIVAAYDGFNPDEPDTEYVSIEYEAKKAADYITENFEGKIDIMCGCSTGAWIMTEAIMDARITVHTAIADGFVMKMLPGWCKGWVGNLEASAMLFLTKHTGLAEKMFGQPKEELEKKVYMGATKQSYKNAFNNECGYKIKFESFEKTDMHIWHGDFEKPLIKIAEKYLRNGKKFTHKIVKDSGHGGLFNQPERMLTAINAAYNHVQEYQI